MTRLFIALFAAAASLSAAQPKAPADLTALAVNAGVEGTLVEWCSGEFRARGQKAYAVAVRSAKGGGRYLVLEAGTAVAELAPFTGAPELSCYTPAAARKLNASIRISETISGNIAPLFATTVVCGFIEDTTAVCWQYSAKARAFVKVGGWHT